jgi:hypothetical protein
MSETNAAFVDPKTQYLTSLIRQVDKITMFLGYKQVSDAALELGVLLDRINIPEARSDLELLREAFDEENYIERSRSDVRVCFRKVCNYLNMTYFKGYDAAIKDKDFDELEEGSDA